MKKKLICLFLCVTLLLTMSSSIYANEIEDNDEYAEEEYAMEGTPSLARWSNVAAISAGLSISSGKATTGFNVQGYSKVTKIVVYTYYQKKVNGSWENLNYVINSKAADYIVASNSSSSGIIKGYTYRARLSIYAYVGTVHEHITVYSNTVSY